ncbi:hypothetical protein M0813_25919 [Anaeramoeba flamelloides]|uniref:Uncharacterized protein n=1 Tax=Anaeramoeba flamelloides TaxID=1746091 RepID=A0ABQ8Y4Q7_9EUKA|nr:hypothetical protein M0813_25919 [Anaeramoeba flamelloides]
MVFTITELSMFAPEVYDSSQLSELNFSDLFYDTTYLRDENEGNEKDNRKTVFSQNNNTPFSRRMNPFLSTVIDNHPLNYGYLNKMKTKNSQLLSHAQHPWKQKPSTSFGNNENGNSTTALKGKETKSNRESAFKRRNVGVHTSPNRHVHYSNTKTSNSNKPQPQQTIKTKTDSQRFGISKTNQQQASNSNDKPRKWKDHNHRYGADKSQIGSNSSKGNSPRIKTNNRLQTNESQPTSSTTQTRPNKKTKKKTIKVLKVKGIIIQKINPNGTPKYLDHSSNFNNPNLLNKEQKRESKNYKILVGRKRNQQLSNEDFQKNTNKLRRKKLYAKKNRKYSKNKKYKERGIENKKYTDTYSETDTEIYTNTESELESDTNTDTGTGTGTDTQIETKSESETNTDIEGERKINNEDSKKHFSPVNDKNSKNSKYYYKKSSKGKNSNELSERKHSRRAKNHYFKSLSPKSKKKFRKKKKKLNKSNHGSRSQSYRRKKKKRHKNH